jgi:hypothetical protein
VGDTGHIPGDVAWRVDPYSESSAWVDAFRGFTLCGGEYCPPDRDELEERENEGYLHASPECGAGLLLSEDRQCVYTRMDRCDGMVATDPLPHAGQHYAQFTIIRTTGDVTRMGLVPADAPFDSDLEKHVASMLGAIEDIVVGDRIGMLLNYDAGTLTVYMNHRRLDDLETKVDLRYPLLDVTVKYRWAVVMTSADRGPDPDDVTWIRIDVRASPPEQVSAPVDTWFGKEYKQLAAAAVLIQRTYRGWTVRMVRFGKTWDGHRSLRWYNRHDPDNRGGGNSGLSGNYGMVWSARQSASQRYQEQYS